MKRYTRLVPCSQCQNGERRGSLTLTSIPRVPSSGALAGSLSVLRAMVGTVSWQVVEGDMESKDPESAGETSKRETGGENKGASKETPLDITSVIYATPLTQSLVTCEKSKHH